MTSQTIRELPNFIDAGDHPYLQDAWTPLLQEVNATDLKVLDGEVPRDLDGVYLRNTQNPVFPSLG